MQRGILFTLSSLTFLACAMDIDPQLTTVGPTPPSQKQPPPSRRSPPIDTEPGDPGPCPANVPLTQADLDKEIGWKAAKGTPGACTAADLTTLEANFKNTNIKTYFDLGAGLTDSCFGCVFSKDIDETWNVIVGTAENNGETGFFNVGACAGFTGGPACGRARQFEEFCYNVACNECTTTSSERETCKLNAKTGGGMCTAFASESVRECADAGAGCGTPIDDARTLCGPPKDEDAGM